MGRERDYIIHSLYHFIIHSLKNMKIGIIGLGDMGKIFARLWASAGFEVLGCDLPQNQQQLEITFADTNVQILDDGVAISRICDFILYAVEAENLEKVVAQYAPSTKYGAIVSGQTSVKTPEIEAFEKYLPKDTHIVSCHSLHGPAVNPIGQTLAVIRHRATDETYQTALKIFKTIGSNIYEMANYHEHDAMMADIQAITHIGFESIGTAWSKAKVYPWESNGCKSGLDNVKILMTLRIYSYKFHVYSGLALMNPYARRDVRQYAQSVLELFELMLTENKEAFRKRILKAKEFVFKDAGTKLMLDDALMNEFALNKDIGGSQKPNSHLSLLAMVDTWHKLKVNPYQNKLCQTPPFKLRVGMAEYLFMNEHLLEEAIETALFDKSIRKDDLLFHTAVHEWASIIEYGSKKAYQEHFEATKHFLADRLEEGRQQSSILIEKLVERN